jgi:ERCC4-related helicase
LKNCRGHEEEGKAPSGDPNALSRILQFRRKLTIATASTKLSRLEHVLNKFELGTLMQNIETQNFRSCHHDVDWMINITKRPSDGAIKNREDRLRYLCEGSPKLRYLLQQLRDIVDKKQNDKPHKILLTEDVPTVAWFWELVCRWLYIDARVLHSGMTQTERDDLVDRFNDPTDPLCVLINMYSVSATGINLDRSCCYILIMTPGPSPSHEVQAWGRVRRVSFRLCKCKPCFLLTQ